ncbi:LOW QUALITY PROTEIN: glutamate-5-semialdehyde dehydrogenase [Endogone sp. FLAS-F59071]|nr:LOW QUALITY PROTEIN: glutamate-5-semialdehyde dehydrogenase [Endogone sp. FLAS-F59071]|eukprot:RUS16010.1 LOW QUALITY PROTEIN: glutamate-5-semialdehyde dehydrogenase [Endogone sp. FLAS-F59071]
MRRIKSVGDCIRGRVKSPDQGAAQKKEKRLSEFFTTTMTNDQSQDIVSIARAARIASTALQSVTTQHKSEALFRIREVLEQRRDQVFEANRLDKQLAEKQVAQGILSSSLFARLDITGGSKYDTILAGLADVVALPDPSNRVTLATRLDNGLDLYRVSCSVGVLLTIFEARPEVVVNISALALKSGNAVILKGGKEAIHTNAALADAIREALASLPEGNPVPRDAVQIVETREEISALLELDRYIDLVVPRGSNSLVKYIQNNTRIPVLGHADGLCSVYIDKDADVDKAVRVAVDSKEIITYQMAAIPNYRLNNVCTSARGSHKLISSHQTTYPAACNSAETLLLHSSLLSPSSSILHRLATAFFESSVHLRCDPPTLAALEQLFPADTPFSSFFTPSVSDDYDTEFLALVMAVRAVQSVEEAVEHVNEHGSKHTDAIVTEDERVANYFMTRVDAAGVFWNASTRFSDGFRYGFGAEVGVSTNKTHARGPVGLEGLVIYKYRIHGNGHATADYSGSGANARKFLHEVIPEAEYKVEGRR